MVSNRVDFVVITPLAEELDAILDMLPNPQKHVSTPEDIHVYYAAELPFESNSSATSIYSIVVLPLTQMGQTEAASATLGAIQRWRPRYVLLVGIAGGIAKSGAKLGDVLISNQIVDYEQAKITEQGTSIRWQVHRADQRLLIAAQNFKSEHWIKAVLHRPDKKTPEVHFGPICTGNKVIAENSLAKQLQEVWAKLIGVEMEAGGVANAILHSAQQPGFFMIRGVSDLADGNKDSKYVKRWRHYACNIAASYTIEFLKSGPVPGKNFESEEVDKHQREDQEEVPRLSDQIDKVSNIQDENVSELIGILTAPDVSEINDEIVRYAFAQIRKTISSELLRRPDDTIIADIVWDLIKFEPLPNKIPDLLAFAVLCHDHAAGLKNEKLRDQLNKWISNVCNNTQFSLEIIRGHLPKQNYEKIHRLAIEIAWPSPIHQGKSEAVLPEVYVRWGRLRERIDQIASHSDRHRLITVLLDSIKKSEPLGIINVDHVEILLDSKEMHQLWEYRAGTSIESEFPDWQPYPVVVRLAPYITQNRDRACPKDSISEQHIACSESHKDRFLEIVQDKGVFVASTYESDGEHPCTKVKAALSWASIGIWTRTVYQVNDRLREVLANCAVEDVPRRIHNRRAISEPGSIWRNIVTLFDPKLPQFKFSYEAYDSSYQYVTNTVLG